MLKAIKSALIPPFEAFMFVAVFGVLLACGLVVRPFIGLKGKIRSYVEDRWKMRRTKAQIDNTTKTQECE
jgi:uncharacterized membrane protein YciS (DUF1049 family)